MPAGSGATVSGRGVASSLAETAARAAGRGAATAPAVVRVDVHKGGHPAVVAGDDAAAVDGARGTGVCVSAGRLAVVEALGVAGANVSVRATRERERTYKAPRTLSSFFQNSRTSRPLLQS